MSSIELVASGAATMFAKEGPFIKHQGREPFLFSIFCYAGAGGGQRFRDSGEEVFFLALAYSAGSRGCINQLQCASILCLHAVIVFLNLKGPGSQVGGQHRFEAEG